MKTTLHVVFIKACICACAPRPCYSSFTITVPCRRFHRCRGSDLCRGSLRFILFRRRYRIWCRARCKRGQVQCHIEERRVSLWPWWSMRFLRNQLHGPGNEPQKATLHDAIHWTGVGDFEVLSFFDKMRCSQFLSFCRVSIPWSAMFAPYYKP